MIQRGRTYLTEKGRDLLAYCQTGAELHFSRAAIGDGKIETLEQLYKMNKLVNEVKEVTLKGIKHNGNGTSTISVLVDNEKVENGFLMREFGIFAKDPREGEILYAVCAYNDYPDFIPVATQELTEILLDTLVIVSNAENVTINVDRSMLYATKEELFDLAGVGRTNQTVKGNWDLIMDDRLKLAMILTMLKSGGSVPDSGGDISLGENMIKIGFPLSEEEEWDGIYDDRNNRLVV